MNGLPNGWADASLADTCDVIQGQSPPGSTYNDVGEGLPFFQGKAEFGSLFPVPRKWCSAPRKIAEEGDVLLSVRAPVGPTNLCPSRSCIGRGLAAIRPKDGIPSRYVLYALRSLELDIAKMGTGSTFTSISGDVVRGLRIPIAPAAEQHRIVASIEEHLSRLDAAVAALERVRTALSRHRAVVLMAACEGRLVKTGVKQDEWSQVTVEDVAVEVRYGSSAKTLENGNGVPVLRMGNIVQGRLDLESLKFLPREHHEFPDLLLEPGDLLFNRTNSPELVGKSAVYKGTPNPCSFASYLIRIRLGASCLPDFLACTLNSRKGRAWIGSVVSQQVGQANVSGGKLKKFRFALPPLEEQTLIIAEVDRRLSLADAAERTVLAGLAKAKRLRQAILKRAFEGKLVPQDPNDEPASVVLERIRAARATEPTPGARSHRRRGAIKPQSARKGR